MNPSNKLLKETTSMAVYRCLYDLVISGYFQPGEWIRERQIKELLGVSSTPIREGLKMLVQERIVESVPHHGVRVKMLSLKEIEDVYELRADLEGLAAQLAAQRGSMAHFCKMKELLDASKSAEERSPIEDNQFLLFNNEFHDLIVEASGNQALKNSLFQLRGAINLIRIMSRKSNRDRTDMTFKQHSLILEAIMARDSQLARFRTQEHIWDTIKLILESAKERYDGA